jgi:uncharacterized protein (DUF58 family)
MQELNPGWWLAAILITFFAFFLLSMVLRNRAAKKDTIGRSEKETVDTSVSTAPRKDTRKLE